MKLFNLLSLKDVKKLHKSCDLFGYFEMAIVGFILLCAILIFIEFSYVNILIISSTFYFNLSADNLLGAK